MLFPILCLFRSSSFALTLSLSVPLRFPSFAHSLPLNCHQIAVFFLFIPFFGYNPCVRLLFYCFCRDLRVDNVFHRNCYPHYLRCTDQQKKTAYKRNRNCVQCAVPSQLEKMKNDYNYNKCLRNRKGPHKKCTIFFEALNVVKIKKKIWQQQ